MRPETAILRLSRLGYRIEVCGDKVQYKYDGLGQPDLAQVRVLLDSLRTNKREVLKCLKAQGKTLLCNSCPWCQDNPWTRNPDLPKWCGWWWDYLLADNPQCLDRREGRVPDPQPRNSRPRKAGDLKSLNHAPTAATCSECAHFTPARSSPNPTQAWGECRKLDKGRYGVARACDAYQVDTRPKRSREAENF